MARKKGAAGAAAPAVATTPVATPAPVAAAPPANAAPKAKSKASAKPKAKAEARPATAPEPVVQAPVVVDAKKKKPAAKEEAPIVKTVIPVMNKAMKDKVDELQALYKTSPADDKERRTLLITVIQQIDGAVDGLKPQNKSKAAGDLQTSALQVAELEQAIKAAKVSDRAPLEDLLEDAEKTLKIVMDVEGFSLFKKTLSGLRGACQRKLDDMAKNLAKIRDEDQIARAKAKVATLRKLDDAAAASLEVTTVLVSSLNADLVAALDVPTMRRLEQQFNCVIEMPRPAKGGGKGEPAPVYPSVVGPPGEAENMARALQQMGGNGTTKKVLTIQGLTSGARNAVLKELETTAPSVLVVSTGRSEFTFFGKAANIAQAEGKLSTAVTNSAHSNGSSNGNSNGGASNESSMQQAKVMVDGDKARALVGTGGSNVRELEKTSGAMIRVGGAQGGKGAAAPDDNGRVEVIIKGATEEVVASGRAKVDEFLNTLATLFVPATKEALDLLFEPRGSRDATVSEAQAAIRQARSAVVMKFRTVRDVPNLTVSRKATGMALIGSKAAVDKASKEIKDVLVKAAWVFEVVTLTCREHTQLFNQSRVAALAGKHKSDIQFRGKGGEACLVVSGDASTVAKIKTEIDSILEQEGCVETFDMDEMSRKKLLEGQARQLKNVQTSHKVTINVDRASLSVTVIGSKTGVASASKELQSFESKIKAAEAAAITKTITIPSEQVPRIIGHRGAQIRQLREDTGATVDVTDGTDGINSSVTLRGSEEQVAKVEKAIGELLEETPATTAAVAAPTPAAPAKKAPKIVKQSLADIESAADFPKLG